MIDSHCHLNALRYTDAIPDIESVIEKAHQEGIHKMFSICTELEQVSGLEKISERYNNIYHSVGVHPSEWNGEPPSVERLIELSSNPKCKGIGETGLDYHYNDESTWEEQKSRFSIHLQAANKINKPVIVHTRNAQADTIKILKKGNVLGCGGVLHCFTENYEFAKEVLDLGMYISLSGILTFKNAQQIQEVAKKIPLERILIETDSPYLAPVPVRGKPNFPHNVKHVVHFLAELRGEDISQIVDKTTENAIKLFDLR
jgi:TatD DNase family protein